MMKNKRLTKNEKQLLEKEVRREISDAQIEIEVCIKKIRAMEDMCGEYMFPLLNKKIIFLQAYIEGLESIKY